MSENNEKYTYAYALEQLERISQDTAYLREAIAELGKMPPAGGPGDVAGAAKADALGRAVVARETTNQKLIDFYTGMYRDLKSAPTPAESRLELLKIPDLALNSDSLKAVLDAIAKLE